MVNVNKPTSEGEVAELVRQFAQMFPGLVAAAAAATTPIATVPATTTPTDAVPAATTPTAAIPTIASVAPPSTSLTASPMILPSSQGTEGGGSDIHAVFRCPSCDVVHYFTPSGTTPSNSSPNQSAGNGHAGSSTAVAPPQVVRTGHFSAATGDAGGRWYGVVIGRQVGVFQNWQDLVEGLVTGVPGCKYKGFSSFAAAEQFFLDHLYMARIYPHPR